MNKMIWQTQQQRSAYSGASRLRYTADLNGLCFRIEQTKEGWHLSNYEAATGDDFTTPETHGTLAAAKSAAETLAAQY